MRPRSLKRQLLLGALVAVLVFGAAPVIYVMVRDGIEAVRAGDAITAVEHAGIAVGAALVPVIALAAYAHWLSVTSRLPSGHTERVPTVAEDWFLGAAVVVVIFATWPVLTFSYEESRAAWLRFELAAAVGYGLLGVAYGAFAVLCVKRYWNWLR